MMELIRQLESITKSACAEVDRKIAEHHAELAEKYASAVRFEEAERGWKNS